MSVYDENELLYDMLSVQEAMEEVEETARAGNSLSVAKASKIVKGLKAKKAAHDAALDCIAQKRGDTSNGRTVFTSNKRNYAMGSDLHGDAQGYHEKASSRLAHSIDRAEDRLEQIKGGRRATAMGKLGHLPPAKVKSWRRNLGLESFMDIYNDIL